MRRLKFDTTSRHPRTIVDAPLVTQAPTIIMSSRRNEADQTSIFGRPSTTAQSDQPRRTRKDHTTQPDRRTATRQDGDALDLHEVDAEAELDHMGVIRKKTATRGGEGGVKYVCDVCSADITSTVSNWGLFTERLLSHVASKSYRAIAGPNPMRRTSLQRVRSLCAMFLQRRIIWQP